VATETVVENSYSSVSIVQNGNNATTGGLAGQIGDENESISMLRNSFFKGSIINHGNRIAGGLVGNIWSAIENCYVIGSIPFVNSRAIATHIADHISLTNVYWDTESTGTTQAFGTGTGAATGLTTSQMQQQTSFTGWDFDDIWIIDPEINNGYPYLR
jgi:hypothetical protein